MKQVTVTFTVDTDELADEMKAWVEKVPTLYLGRGAICPKHNAIVLIAGANREKPTGGALNCLCNQIAEVATPLMAAAMLEHQPTANLH